MHKILLFCMIGIGCFLLDARGNERPADEQIPPPKPPVLWIGPLEEGEPETRRELPPPWLQQRTLQEKVDGMKRGKGREQFKKRPNPKGRKPREAMFNRA